MLNTVELLRRRPDIIFHLWGIHWVVRMPSLFCFVLGNPKSSRIVITGYDTVSNWIALTETCRYSCL